MPDEKNTKPEQSITTPKPQEAKSSPPKMDGDKIPAKPKAPTPAEKSSKSTTAPKVSKSQKPKEPSKSTEKPKPPDKPTPKPQATTKATQKSKVPPEPAKSEEKVPPPKAAPTLRKGEKIVNLKLSDLHPFKNHPFSVKDDAEMLAMVESVRDKGVTQPAIVRPREDGGYEIVSGHRRQRASELAGLAAVPCIVRNLTDEEATLQMVEDNLNQRDYILPSERAKALKMQFEAIKKQGVKGDGRRSDEVVGERNGMSGKQVQRYIKLNDLCLELLKLVDEKKIAFSPAVIKVKIALVAIGAKALIIGLKLAVPILIVMLFVGSCSVFLNSVAGGFVATMGFQTDELSITHATRHYSYLNPDFTRSTDDAFALIAYLTTTHGEFTYPEIIPVLQDIYSQAVGGSLRPTLMSRLDHLALGQYRIY